MLRFRIYDRLRTMLLLPVLTPVVERSRKNTSAHSLLEVIIAAGIFVMVSIGLSGVWVMHARGMSKTSESMAASFLARSVIEGVKANGWDELESEATSSQPVILRRSVRGRQADIYYHVSYKTQFNTDRLRWTGLPENFCRLIVTVRWKSGTASHSEDDDFDNEEVYVSDFYRETM